MLQSLVADVAGALSTSPSPLSEAAEIIACHLHADRVSLVSFEEDGLFFRVRATAGTELCSRGTRLPIASSSHYCANLEGRRFASQDLSRQAEFDRSSDQLILARGLRSTCSIPLQRGGERVGALNLSAFDTSVDFDEAAGALAGLGGMLTMALTAETASPPTVMICHDDSLYGYGLARLLESSAPASVSVHSSLEDVVGALTGMIPDVIVCDSYLEGRRIDEVVAALRRAGAAAPVLVVASHDTPENAHAAVRAGVSGYLAREQAVDQLGETLGLLRRGRTVLPPERELSEGEALTAREAEVLRAMDVGLRAKQIALELAISEFTVKNHVRNIFRKLGATSRTEALREARRQGLLR